jgi:broad specificity phosphatase PhoE
MTPSDLPEQLWLLRHAESMGNVASARAASAGLEVVEVDRRDADMDLSPLGVRQAEALGRWLAERPPEEAPTVVYSSPYLRARRTAEIALRHSPATGLRLDERLRDRDLGAFDRLTGRGIAARYPDQAELRRWWGKFYHRPPSGESWTDVLLRLRSFLGTLRQDCAGERVAIVAHDVIVLLCRYLFEDLDEPTVLALGREQPVANCGLTRYRRAGDRLVLEAYNEVAPMADEDAPVTSEAGGRGEP